jgi:transcriptional regulator with XRE-family HTH domain
MLIPRSRPSPLRARRLLRGARLYDVATALGVHETMVSLLERGQRRLTPALLARFAEYYSTPAARLREEMDRWAAVNAGNAAAPPPGGWAA